MGDTPRLVPLVVVMPEPPEILPTTLTDSALMVAEPVLTSALEFGIVIDTARRQIDGAAALGGDAAAGGRVQRQHAAGAVAARQRNGAANDRDGRAAVNRG